MMQTAHDAYFGKRETCQNDRCDNGYCRYKRKDKSLKHTLLIVDINNLKNFNDTYGHREGDKIIKRFPI